MQLPQLQLSNDEIDAMIHKANYYKSIRNCCISQLQNNLGEQSSIKKLAKTEQFFKGLKDVCNSTLDKEAFLPQMHQRESIYKKAKVIRRKRTHRKEKQNPPRQKFKVSENVIEIIESEEEVNIYESGIKQEASWFESPPMMDGRRKTSVPQRKRNRKRISKINQKFKLRIPGLLEKSNFQMNPEAPLIVGLHYYAEQGNLLVIHQNGKIQAFYADSQHFEIDIYDSIIQVQFFGAKFFIITQKLLIVFKFVWEKASIQITQLANFSIFQPQSLSVDKNKGSLYIRNLTQIFQLDCERLDQLKLFNVIRAQDVLGFQIIQFKQMQIQMLITEGRLYFETFINHKITSTFAIKVKLHAGNTQMIVLQERIILVHSIFGRVYFHILNYIFEQKQIIEKVYSLRQYADFSFMINDIVLQIQPFQCGQFYGVAVMSFNGICIHKIEIIEEGLDVRGFVYDFTEKIEQTKPLPNCLCFVSEKVDEEGRIQLAFSIDDKHFFEKLEFQ